MKKFEKWIFDDEHAVFIDEKTNKKGIATIDGKIILKPTYHHIFNSIVEWAIIVEKETINNIEILKYGIIDSKLNIIVTPIYGIDTYIEMEKIINQLCENKNDKNKITLVGIQGNSSYSEIRKNDLTKKLNKLKQPN